MAELMKAHVKALMPSFGDGKAYQRRIEALTQEITDLFKKSENLLKKLSSGGPSEDSNIRKSVQRSIATDLQNLSMELRKKQSAYLKRLRQQKEGPDGVDLVMNINGRSRTDEDEFDDVVICCFYLGNIRFMDSMSIKCLNSNRVKLSQQKGRRNSTGRGISE